MEYHYPKKYLFIALFAVFFGLFLNFSVRSGSEVQKNSPAGNALTTILFKNTNVLAEVADTPAKEELGLSGRIELPFGKGMLFAPPTARVYGIWMKDMNFPLDIVWFDNDLKVMYIKENAAPESYPEAFVPSAPSRYVLELPAGFIQRYGVTLGDKVIMD